MKRLLIALAGVGIVAVAAAGSALLVASPAASPTAAASRPPREVVLYGHIKSLTRKGRGFELRFDPAWLLRGATANRAAIEDKLIRPGENVPNDYYIVDEGRRRLTYVVPTTARVTVVTHHSGIGIKATPITVSELAQIVTGKNPRSRPLFGNKLGFWIRVATDTVRSLDQQYQP